MVGNLPKDGGRYIVYDFPITMDDGRKLTRLVFIYWCPEGVSIHNKMVVSSNKVVINGKLDCQLSISCHDSSDVTPFLLQIDEKEITKFVKSKC
jgi:hypothetical protein